MRSSQRPAARVSGARDCHFVDDTLSAVRLSLGERGSPQLEHRAFPQSPYQIVASHFSSSQVYEWLTLLTIVGPDKFDPFVVFTSDGLKVFKSQTKNTLCSE